MSGFPPRGAASSNSPSSANRVAEQLQARTFTEMSAGQKFVATIKRIAKSASNLWKGNEPLQSPARNETLHNHTLRSVHFPSCVAANQSTHFPYLVEHSFSAGNTLSAKAPNVMALLPQLAKSLSNKQGFLYIRDGAGRSPIEGFVEAFKKGGNIELGDNCRIIGAYASEKNSEISPVYIFQIHDSSIEATFDVPVTEAPFDKLKDPANRTEQLIKLKHCMDNHLRALPSPFKDSTECPAIICPQMPRLAQLVTAQEENLGRQFRGELQCRTGAAWLTAGEELLEILSPELPRFVGEESCDFETFFGCVAIGDAGVNPLPYSIGNYNNPSEGAAIRAFKRHLPNPEPGQPETGQSGQATQSAANQQRPNLSVPRQGNISLPALLLQRSQGLAYKEPLEQMQCASQSVNSLLHQHSATASDVAFYLVDRKIDGLKTYGASLADQKGLMLPHIVQALKNKQTVTISKADFMGDNPNEICLATDQTIRESWQKLVNESPLSRGKNWVNNRTELEGIVQLEITANSWMAAQRGTEMVDLLNLVNAQLQQTNQIHLPPAMAHLNMIDHSTHMRQLEDLACRAIAHGKDFPIIVRTGADGEAGHYQTIVPDSNGNWLSLNADQTRQRGVQHCNQWCASGELFRSLQRMGANNILVPAP